MTSYVAHAAWGLRVRVYPKMVYYELLKEGSATSCTDGGKDPRFTASSQPLATRSRKERPCAEWLRHNHLHFSRLVSFLEQQTCLVNCQIMVSYVFSKFLEGVGKKMFLFLKSNRNHIFWTLFFNVPHDSESAPIITASSRFWGTSLP